MVDGGGTLRRIAGTGTGGFTGDGGAASATRLSGPRGVAIAPPGNLFVTDTGNTRIRRLNLATSVAVDPRHSHEGRGRWMHVRVQFPAGVDARDVNLDSVVLQAIAPADGAVVVSRAAEVLQLSSGYEADFADTNRDRVPARLLPKVDRTTVAPCAARPPTPQARATASPRSRSW